MAQTEVAGRKPVQVRRPGKASTAVVAAEQEVTVAEGSARPLRPLNRHLWLWEQEWRNFHRSRS